MNSGQTAERVYRAIKQRVGERAFRPGDRLDPAQLADALNTSVTPVRDALHLLTGEGLVETRIGDGFRLPAIDAPALQDLYDWNSEVVGLAIRAWSGPPRPRNGATAPANVAEGVAELFDRAAEASRNIEHARAVAALNDRLHPARLAEESVIDGVEEELAHLVALLAAGDAGALQRAVAAYHRRRRRAAAVVVRALYRAG